MEEQSAKKASTAADNRKNIKVSRILQVQEIIDFLVLSELLQGPLYVREIDGKIVDVLHGVGVSLTYLWTRLDFMEKQGHIKRFWTDDTRYNRHCKITDIGVTYHKMMLPEMIDKNREALTFHKNMGKYISRFDT